MIDETKTKDQLLVDLKAALNTGDFKAVAKVSRDIDKIVQGEEKAEKEAKVAALVGITEDVRKALDKAADKFIEALDPATLEAMDGIWYARDFEEALTTCRITKGSAKKSGGSGGGGKKFTISTSELMQKHGSELMGDSGKTFQEAYDEDTGGNSRYKVRMKLLKAEGLS